HQTSTMADLSALLNPSPVSGPVAEHAESTADKTEYGKIKAINLPPVETGAPNVQPSIKSPLDTLAEAASSAQILSPSNPNSSVFNNISAYPQSNPHSTSRPSSSHFSPPRSYDHPHLPAPISPTFGTGLQRYHHPTSHEVKARRASETAEPAMAALPPIRNSLPEDHPSLQQSGIESMSGDRIQEPLPTVSDAVGVTESHPVQENNNDALMTTQIRQPSPGAAINAQASNLPAKQSDQTEVKTEITDVAPDLTSTSAQPPVGSTDLSSDARARVLAAEAAEVKAEPTPAPTIDPPPNTALKPKPAPSRKRAAPKKGIANTVKPAAKKRKVDTAESIEKSSPRAHAGSPASRRASKTPAPKGRKKGSATPQRSPSIAADDDDDEDGVFCICRGPDNHTWMIACDGPCEDWFHGRCIGMTEKEGELIEKYYCPNCTEAGDGETMWKRMCRLDDCRRPARVNGEKKSKYCSDEHGAEYMKRNTLKQEEEEIEKKAAVGLPTIPPKSKGRKTNNSFAFDGSSDPAPMPDTSEPTVTKEADEPLDPKFQSQLRGGILRREELRALVTSVDDLSGFRKLGDAVLTPPPTAAPGNETKPPTDVQTEAVPPGPTEAISMAHHIPYTPAEASHLADLTAKKDALRAQKKACDDRETLFTLVRERAKVVLEEMKKKDKSLKDICGFDARLVWTDEEFDIWRASPEGRKALHEEKKLAAPTALDVPEEMAPHLHRAQVNGDDGGQAAATNGEQHAGQEEFGKGVCPKKRCERHKAWVKLQQTDIAFAKDEVRQKLKKLDEEEQGVRDRAKHRWLSSEA
ncbi:MAG: hypothetical protein Q9183_002073, partial [Haloplaca sp. 2 TL-2023]